MRLCLAAPLSVKFCGSVAHFTREKCIIFPGIRRAAESHKYLLCPMDGVGTTIHVDEKTRDRLKELKTHPGESYGRVVERLLELRADEGELSVETMRDIGRGINDVKAGRTLSMGKVKARLKIR